MEVCNIRLRERVDMTLTYDKRFTEEDLDDLKEWLHSDDEDEATAKAIDNLTMAIVCSIVEDDVDSIPEEYDDLCGDIMDYISDEIYDNEDPDEDWGDVLDRDWSAKLELVK